MYINIVLQQYLHHQGSLVGRHLWGHIESDTTEETAAAAAARHNHLYILNLVTILSLKPGHQREANYIISAIRCNI